MFLDILCLFSVNYRFNQHLYLIITPYLLSLFLHKYDTIMLKLKNGRVDKNAAFL